jgi:acetolactate synthase regulatory subunit
MPTTNLTLQVQPGTDVLDRVVCTCRRRNLRILTLTYTAEQITLTVAGEDRQARSIERWLSLLVDVIGLMPQRTPSRVLPTAQTERLSGAPGSTCPEPLTGPLGVVA